jgi:hypothetical protein
MKQLICAALVGIVCLALLARREDVRRFRERHNI